MHALHTVHAVPDLCIAAGRLRDGSYHELLFVIADSILTPVLAASRYPRPVMTNYLHAKTQNLV